MSDAIAARLVVLDTRTGSLVVDKLVFIDGDPAETMARYRAQHPEEHHKLFAIAREQEAAQLPAPQLAAHLTEMLGEAERGWWDRLKGRIKAIAGAGIVLSALGCASGAPAPVADVWLGDRRDTTELAELAARVEVPPDGNIVAVPIGADARTSHAVIGVRDREVLHVHAEHDLVVLILEGHGTMHLGGEDRAVSAGSLVYVPRGTVHAFVNGADRPSKAYAVFSPPYDGTDMIPVDP